MSDDGISEELGSGSDGPPEGFEDAIKDCLQRNTAGLTIKTIRAYDKVAFAAGNYEQHYQVDVFKPVNGGTKDGIAHVEAYKEGVEWKADFIQLNMF